MSIISSKSIIFRFKLADSLIERINLFAKLYQYSDRVTYKEEWSRWIENNTETISQEKNRLAELGYTGNLTNKMYKSGRYYFRNKKENTPRKRRQYISIDKALIKMMDNYIAECSRDIKPSICYLTFCETESIYILIEKEITRLLLVDGLRSKDLIKDKIKKTFKNRYFLITKT
jgi:hypothetical protein